MWRCYEVSKEFTIFTPPREKLFEVSVIEHAECKYEVWAFDSSDAIKKMKKGHGFRMVLSENKDILESKKVMESE